ncbi:MAG: type VI secretion system membrane subunit TssM [Proteobacteria bacterium]|nr:type VI secretion system membrane subunit TssM [Pseudomonadota bacterium]
MRKLLGLVFNRWTLSAVLLIALACVIWIVGPAVTIGTHRPFDSEAQRWTAIGVLTGIVFILLIRQAWRARAGQGEVARQLLTPAPAAAKEAESADLAAVRERFERALVLLKRVRFGDRGLLHGWRARLGGRYLYELPWYLIIGAPGSGKTTALQNSGLKFPLADALGDYKLRGVAGTRHCDWWFTDRAVLIDTAGRFTTQDSDRENDRATWSGFLAMLHRTRPRQPINGVLVAVSATELLAMNADERAEHAAAVRKRLQELHEGLNVRFPIYLLVTKCDLLAGFTDTFAQADRDLRAAPWGCTFALDASGQRNDAAVLDAEFERLQQRLVDGVVERLQRERDPQRRARIYGFPGQFAALRGTLREFVDTVFSPSRFEAHPMLRGVYCVSGTQEGTPIDRVLGIAARSYGLERSAPAPNQASGRSYFLSRLLGEVVFAESGLAGTNLRWERRRSLLALSAYAACGMLAIALIAAFTVSYRGNRRYVADVAARAHDVQQLVQGTPNRASPDLLPIIPALEATRVLAETGDASAAAGSASWQLGFGLFQGRKLDRAARTAYERMLTDAMLPRIALRLRQQLQSGEAPESQYESLKAYLMLYDVDHFDAKALKSYIENDWATQRGAELSAAQRAQLSRHLDALLALPGGVPPLARDDKLVASVRAQLGSVALPQRIYDRLLQSGLDDEFPEFTIARAAGGSAPLVFRRTSGKPLTQGVPGLYTREGYTDGFQKAIDRVAAQLEGEQGWVLGAAAPPRDPVQRLQGGVTDDVRRLYLTDYATTWTTFIDDIRVVSPSSLTQSLEIARLLSAPDSPLPLLMRALSRQTTLAGSSDGNGVIDKATSKAGALISSGAQRVAGLVNGDQPRAPRPAASLEATLVDARFAELRAAVTAPEGGKAPLDGTIALLNDLYVYLNTVDTAVKGGMPPPQSPVGNQIKAQAPAAPKPLRALLEDVGTTSSQIAKTMVRGNLSAEVRSQVGEFCQQALAGRYPLDRGSSRDATQADFASVFAPGGKFDKLFQDKLLPYVDTSTRPWRFRTVDGSALGADAGTLPQFQRAAAIRDAFFAGGATTPSLRLEFKPVEMDPAISQFLLDIDGQIVRYAHGPQIPTAVQWPGPRGSTQVRVEISPASPNSSGMVSSGPWALFRLFERVRIDDGGAPERFRATFDIDGRKAIFEVTTSSVRNPFQLAELGQFSCPNAL